MSAFECPTFWSRKEEIHAPATDTATFIATESALEDVQILKHGEFGVQWRHNIFQGASRYRVQHENISGHTDHNLSVTPGAGVAVEDVDVEVS